jgi:protein-arginine kinase activator protein McsA
VALAVRVDAPIFVAPMVLDEAGIVAEDESDISSLAEQAEETTGAEEDEPAGTELEQMQQKLEEAVEKEDYERAAELRDEIQRLEQEQQQNQN